MKNALATVEYAENKLGIQKGLLLSLLFQDDWSFILKCSALCESVLRYRIKSFNVEEYDSSAKKNDINLKKNIEDDGDIPQRRMCNYARQNNLFGKGVIEFIQAVIYLRNEIAHDIKSLEFQLNGEEYKNKEKAVIDSFEFLRNVKETNQFIPDFMYISNKIVNCNLRVTIWSGVLSLVSYIGVVVQGETDKIISTSPHGSVSVS